MKRIDFLARLETLKISELERTDAEYWTWRNNVSEQEWEDYLTDLTVLEQARESPSLPKDEQVDKFADLYEELLWRAYASGEVFLRELITVPTTVTHDSDALVFFQDVKEYARQGVKLYLASKIEDADEPQA
jgi:hypothetical protein